MIVLTGTNLNKRHQEFNAMVNEAANNNVKFEDIRDINEKTDLDRIFKIDLASKYKIIKYILDNLKSGDSFYISRALKCDWIFKDEFAQFMNPQYLEENILPLMPPRMKKKVFATISMRLQNAERAEEFHHYCMRNRMHKFGMDFLLRTNESFKISILTQHPHIYNDFHRNDKYLQQFIGNSFVLAEYYLKVVTSASDALYHLRYLYSVSDKTYLDLIETYQRTVDYYLGRTSPKISLHVMKKHKNRVINNPWFYLHLLDPNIVFQHSNIEDAKLYAVAFLPDTSYQFWGRNFCDYTNFFLILIPFHERFHFLKKIYMEKYPGEEFEENMYFYTYKYYDMMTDDEKENWALKHIDSGNELHGFGNDYIWYRFVNFHKALPELKKYILKTSDNDKRSSIVQILLESVKTEDELSILMDYYYKRHVNELKEFKINFMLNVIKKHNILNVNNKCWSLVEQILYSLDAYNELSEDRLDYRNNEFRVLAFIYYIVHDHPVPKVLQSFLMSGTITVYNLRWAFDNYLEPMQLLLIAQYVLTLLSTQVEKMITEAELNVDEIRRLINELLDLIFEFKKDYEEIPQTIRDFILSHYEFFKNYRYLYKPEHSDNVDDISTTPTPKLRIADIMHYLKENSLLIISNFPEIKQYFEETNGKKNINWLIHKLKIYFPNDLAPEYIQFMKNCLSAEDLCLHTARVAVYGILILSDENHKIEFVKNYIPTNSKIDHANISANLLTIQKAICSVSCHSRPALPLSSIREYIKGDYLQYCIPIFDSYRTNLIPAQFMCFVESLLDNPVSIQKHGLRFAFHCFDVVNLKNLVLKAWKKTKNVSLRKIIYTFLHEKINFYHDNLPVQWDLFGALNIITHDLNEDDDEVLFELLNGGLPQHLLGQHLQTAYILVSTFPPKEVNYSRLSKILSSMESNIELVHKETLFVIIKDHILSMLVHEKMLNENYNYSDSNVINAKWSLTNTFIIKYKNINLINLVMDKIIPEWHKTKHGSYVYRTFFIEMLCTLENLSFSQPIEEMLNINNVFKAILSHLVNTLAPSEIYIIVWDINLNILTRQVLGENASEIKVKDSSAESEHKSPNKEVILKFSYKVKDLMKEYLDNGKLFCLFYPDIMPKINTVMEKLASVLNSFTDDRIYSVDGVVLLCSVLSQCNARKITTFIVSLLPVWYHGVYHTEYLDIINKLKSDNNHEILYFCRHKFSSNGQFED